MSVSTVTIQEAQARLPDLIHKLTPGEEVVITENNQPVAKLVSEQPQPKPGLRPPPGLGKGLGRNKVVHVGFSRTADVVMLGRCKTQLS
jgi:prevent-host-death family protein